MEKWFGKKSDVNNMVVYNAANATFYSCIVSFNSSIGGDRKYQKEQQSIAA